MKQWHLLLVTLLFLGLQACGGGGGVKPDDPEPPKPECPEGQVGTPPNCTKPPKPECPEGQVGTPPNCVEPPLTLNEQHRKDAGLSKIAPNGVWPTNHRAIVKPKFAVVESTTDRRHGKVIQAAACVGYAPGGCTVNVSSNDVQGVSNAPFTYIEPRDPNHDGGVFQVGEIAQRLREHPDLRIASMSASLDVSVLEEMTAEGVHVVWGAGNDGDVVNWRTGYPGYWDAEEHFPDEELQGDRLLRSIANHEILIVAGYTKDAEGNFIPHHQTTQCGDVDGGCLYAPFVFDFTDQNGELVQIAGTSVAAPFTAAGLASVLAVFPETSGEELIRLAKACAVDEPGLPNGLGRFSLSCMDNSDVFHLPRGTTVDEETMQTVQARATSMVQAFAHTPLPGDSQFTMDVEGVSLTRDMEGGFAHRSGISLIPQYRGVEGKDDVRVNLFYDYDNQAPGLRVGTKEYFLAGSWTNQNSFFGYDQYQTDSFNVAAGTNNLYLRMTTQHGEHDGGGVVDEVEGSSIGATLTHTMATPIGAFTPFVHVDKFSGGKATTHSGGTMQLNGSEWNTELGLSAETQLSEQGRLSVTATASHRGDLDRDDYGVRAGYRLLF